MVSCIAIDDEPIALDVIKAHAEKIPFINLKGRFLSPMQAMKFMNEEAVDLVFLDINMPDLSGTDLARHIIKKAGVIFITAHADYAIEAFELSAIDYLLKPIPFDRFFKACLRAQEHFTIVPSNESPKSIFVKDGYEWTKIMLEDLLYVEASDNYVTFHETKKKTTVRMTLTQAEEKLPADFFMRIHKSFIVNFSKVEKIDPSRVTINQVSIPVSDTYRNILLGKIK